MRIKIFIILSVLLLVACEGSDQSGSGEVKSETQAKAKRTTDFATVQKGFRLYRTNCAACHGDAGQGALNWQQAGPDGKYPPPPLNGSGHTWHHPAKAILRTIRDGSLMTGGTMPAWKGKLSDKEIMAIIAWFQSRWPDELYQTWARTNHHDRK